MCGVGLHVNVRSTTGKQSARVCGGCTGWSWRSKHYGADVKGDFGKEGQLDPGEIHMTARTGEGDEPTLGTPEAIPFCSIKPPIRSA